MKRVFRITTTITILDERAIFDLFEVKRQIESGQFQQDMEEGKKCKVIATFEELTNKQNNERNMFYRTSFWQGCKEGKDSDKENNYSRTKNSERVDC